MQWQTKAAQSGIFAGWLKNTHFSGRGHKGNEFFVQK
jgi:hypothetical protein